MKNTMRHGALTTHANQGDMPRLVTVDNAGAPCAPSPAPETRPDVPQVYVDKPLGISFGRGNDGAAYVTKLDAKRGNTDEQMEVPACVPAYRFMCRQQRAVHGGQQCQCTARHTQVGDKVVNISASFGSDVWEAKNYGQVVYAIKTRNGQVYLRLQRKFGDLSALQVGAAHHLCCVTLQPARGKGSPNAGRMLASVGYLAVHSYCLTLGFSQHDSHPTLQKAVASFATLLGFEQECTDAGGGAFGGREALQARAGWRQLRRRDQRGPAEALH